MRSSYQEKDVTILLTDVTGRLAPLDAKEREKRIQSGVHYSEMLPMEYRPTPEYMRLYEESLELHGGLVAKAVMTAAEKIIQKKGKGVVLVSLARAGTPVGILMKHYLDRKYGICVPHYTISIIRGRGIDEAAMSYILDRHPVETVQFVDGWVGKGAILTELLKEAQKTPGLSGELAVLADPAGLGAIYGTREDFLIPSACLNSTVSGLFSRTILNREILSPTDFHGAVYFSSLAAEDVSYSFLAAVERDFDLGFSLEDVKEAEEKMQEASGMDEVRRIAADFSVSDINFIKPGIGETTRVLLRRIPWRVLVRDLSDEVHIAHIKNLCRDKDVPIIEYPLSVYRAVGLIRDLHADV